MTASLVSIAPYVIFCLVLAYLGKEKKFGFWGNFFVSLILTPFIGLIVLLAQDTRPAQAA
ncbi:MAG: hypothetical protein Q7P63_15495 [Verrucomicrobiota bacterium JB022]|nr:hypothetical protein [Verrucomicrobiota bacterium JB022]